MYREKGNQDLRKFRCYEKYKLQYRYVYVVKFQKSIRIKFLLNGTLSLMWIYFENVTGIYLTSLFIYGTAIYPVYDFPHK